MRRLVLPALIVVCLGAAAFVHTRLQGQQDQAARRTPDPVYLPPAAAVRLASLGHRPLAADWYWLQGLQYYGDEVNRKTYYGDLHRFLDLSAALDADFHEVYLFGGFVLPYHRGGWHWMNVPAATDLIQRGLKRFPDDWRLWQQLAFIKGIIGTDYRAAADAVRHAAAAPGSPPWLPKLVTRLYASGGQLDRAEAYAREILSNTDDADLGRSMAHRLEEIELERTLRSVDAAIGAYRKQTGHAPQTLSALVEAKLLPRMPVSPFGGSIRIEDGRAVADDLLKGRLRVFEEDTE